MLSEIQDQNPQQQQQQQHPSKMSNTTPSSGEQQASSNETTNGNGASQEASATGNCQPMATSPDVRAQSTAPNIPTSAPTTSLGELEAYYSNWDAQPCCSYTSGSNPPHPHYLQPMPILSDSDSTDNPSFESSLSSELTPSELSSGSESFSKEDTTSGNDTPPGLELGHTMVQCCHVRYKEGVDGQLPERLHVSTPRPALRQVYNPSRPKRIFIDVDVPSYTVDDNVKSPRPQKGLTRSRTIVPKELESEESLSKDAAARKPPKRVPTGPKYPSLEVPASEDGSEDSSKDGK